MRKATTFLITESPCRPVDKMSKQVTAMKWKWEEIRKERKTKSGKRKTSRGRGDRSYLALVQSLNKVSKSFLDMSLQRLTPGWMAPSPLRILTCSTVQTTGVISSLFNLV